MASSFDLKRASQCSDSNSGGRQQVQHDAIYGVLLGLRELALASLSQPLDSTWDILGWGHTWYHG